MFVVQHKILKWGFSLCYPVFWLISLLYGHETWWMELSLDANNSEGQFKVTGLTIVVWTWNLVDGVILVDGVTLDANNYEGQFKVTRCHPRSNGLPLLYGNETWWMESPLVENSFLGQFKVTRGHLRSNGLPLLCGHETWKMESSLDAKHY